MHTLTTNGIGNDFTFRIETICSYHLPMHVCAFCVYAFMLSDTGYFSIFLHSDTNANYWVTFSCSRTQNKEYLLFNTSNKLHRTPWSTAVRRPLYWQLLMQDYYFCLGCNTNGYENKHSPMPNIRSFVHSTFDQIKFNWKILWLIYCNRCCIWLFISSPTKILPKYVKRIFAMC